MRLEPAVEAHAGLARLDDHLLDACHAAWYQPATVFASQKPTNTAASDRATLAAT